MTDPQVPYSESRTGRGDKWYATMGELRAKTEALQKYADAHKAFSQMIEDALKALPQDDSREIARAELIQFIAGRIRAAQAHKVRQLKVLTGMEAQGVPDK